MSPVRLKDEDVEWVVNDMAELGVKIGDQFFFLYKGRSIDYSVNEDGAPNTHENGEKMKWRHVGRREFGETCQPWDHMARVKGVSVDQFSMPESYVGFHPEESQPDFNNPWREMP